MRKFRFQPSCRLWVVIVVFLPALMLMAQEGYGEYGDVVLNKTAEAHGMSPVIFPHWFHRIRFRCKVCHGELGFEMRAGANTVTMGEIIEGKFCGMCHNGQIAWSTVNCVLCHSGKKGLKSGIRGGHSTLGPGRW